MPNARDGTAPPHGGLRSMMAESAPATRTLRLHRFKRGDAAPHADEYDVPIDERTTVLEALRWIQLHEDPTVGLRHSCFHASCGTCGVRVNGRERLACVTPVSEVSGTITVDPIANLPVLHDVVVDMAPFVARFPTPHPIVRESELPPEAGTPGVDDAFERYEDCIECGLCLSACPVAATDDTYLGPAALAYAQRLLEEPRADRDAILDWADQDAGAWRCHAAFECTEACPSDVRPAQRIMSLRKDLRRRRKDQGRELPERPPSPTGASS
jgi:succinate dehydrogenase / fumarate reductase, iron-sulfur subunit